MSITPGTSKAQVRTSSIGTVVKSETLNIQTPVEYGRTVVGGVQNISQAATSLPT